MCMCIYLYVCSPQACGCPERPEGSLESPATGVTVNCEPPAWELDTEPGFSAKAASALTSKPSFQPLIQYLGASLFSTIRLTSALFSSQC